MVLNLANALAVAKRIGIGRIYLPVNELLRTEFEVEGVRFIQGAPPVEHNTLRGAFWHPSLRAFAPVLNDLGDAAKKLEPFHLFQVGILPLSGKGWVDSLRIKINLWARFIAKSLSREITIHIRSGNIFLTEHPNGAYWDVPLSYYTHVIEQERPGKVTLVYEDTSNPVIPALTEWLRKVGIRHKLQDGPVDAAIQEVAAAQHVVGGRGSFLIPILAMNQHLKKITWFGEKPSPPFPLHHLPRVQAGDVQLTVVDSGSYEQMVAPWRNSRSQRVAMTNYRIED